MHHLHAHLQRPRRPQNPSLTPITNAIRPVRPRLNPPPEVDEITPGTSLSMPPVEPIVASQIKSASVVSSLSPRQQRPPLKDADFKGIEEAWLRFWAEAGFGTPKDLNRLLARSMREQTAGDPWALDLARQDGKDFL